ncbi:MAG: hypothetical protein ACXWR0_05070 [Bdellovibrio sp.]
MRKCPRCECYTLTSEYSGFCVHCNYSSETDVTVQFNSKKSPSRESTAAQAQRQKKLQLVKPNRKEDEYAEEFNFNHL